MVPRGGPAIWDVMEERTAVEVRQKRQYPHTQKPPRDPVGSPELHSETHLAKP